MRFRRLATVAGLLFLTLALLLSLSRCGGGSVCMCPLGYVCVTVDKTTRSWRCEPSPMPPTWLAGQRDGGVEEVTE